MNVWVHFSNVIRFAGLWPVGWRTCRIPAPETGNSTAARMGRSNPVFAYNIWQHSSGRLEIDTRTTCPSVNHAFRGVYYDSVVSLTSYVFYSVDASTVLITFLCGNRSLPTSRPYERDSIIVVVRLIKYEKYTSIYFRLVMGRRSCVRCSV